MKILIVSQYFWPENFRINDLALGLKERGHQVSVLTGLPNYPNGKIFEGYGVFGKYRDDHKGIKIKRVPIYPRGRGRPLALILNYLSFVVFSVILGPFLCRGKFDQILVYEPSPITVGIPAIILKKLKKAPLFLWVQDLWPESLEATGTVRSKGILDVVGRLVRWIYKKCDMILISSRAFASSVEARGGDPKNIRYFPNGAESLYRPVILDNDARERAVIPDGFNVMFAGNIGEAQDFGTILNAAELTRDMPDINWVVLGDGRMRPWVESQIKQRGLSNTVHLLGAYPVNAMPGFFSIADTLLVSLKREPIFALTVPAKIQSYLACGKPIIAALDGEGARMVKEAQAGLVCPAEDPKALAEVVVDMYKMTASERSAMGQRGRSYFENNFDREKLLSDIESWMKPKFISGDLIESIG